MCCVKKDNKESFTIKITFFSYFGKKQQKNRKNIRIKKMLFFIYYYYYFFIIAFIRVSDSFFFLFVHQRPLCLEHTQHCTIPAKSTCPDIRVLMRFVSGLRSARTWRRSHSDGSARLGSLKNKQKQNKKRSQKIGRRASRRVKPRAIWSPSSPPRHSRPSV